MAGTGTFCLGLCTWREGRSQLVLGRSQRVEPPELSVEFTCRNFSQYGAEVEKVRAGIKNCGQQNPNAVWALLSSLLALTRNFQQNYHNYQVMVTPNKMVGLYGCDCPLNEPPVTIFAVWFVPSTRIFLATTVYMVLDLCCATSQRGRSQYQEDPSQGCIQDLALGGEVSSGQRPQASYWGPLRCYLVQF